MIEKWRREQGKKAGKIDSSPGKALANDGTTDTQGEPGTPSLLTPVHWDTIHSHMEHNNGYAFADKDAGKELVEGEGGRRKKQVVKGQQEGLMFFTAVQYALQKS